MSFIQHNGLRYFQFGTLQTRHALFTRHGGVSPDPWGSLNVGGTVGDDLARVRENRLLSFQALIVSRIRSLMSGRFTARM